MNIKSAADSNSEVCMRPFVDIAERRKGVTFLKVVSGMCGHILTSKV